MTEREAKNLWACLLSMRDDGTINEEQMLRLAGRFGLLE